MCWFFSPFLRLACDWILLGVYFKARVNKEFLTEVLGKGAVNGVSLVSRSLDETVRVTPLTSASLEGRKTNIYLPAFIYREADLGLRASTRGQQGSEVGIFISFPQGWEEPKVTQPLSEGLGFEPWPLDVRTELQKTKREIHNVSICQVEG